MVLTRGSGLEFTKEGYRSLDRFALQIAQIVQDIRLSRQGERQARRTPLIAIKGYSIALIHPDVTWTSEMSREFRESIDRENDCLNRGVSQLLPAVQDKPALEGLTLQTLSIDPLFDKIQADMGLIDWSKVVEFHCESGLPLAFVNHSWLVQGLCHLIRCAAEWTPQQVGIQVEACWRQGYPAVVIESINRAWSDDVGFTE